MNLVIIESPYKGDVRRNLRYLQACIRDCIRRGDSPYASHRMLTAAFDDNDPEQRRIGIAAGLAWRHAYRQTASKEAFDRGGASFERVLPVFYTDIGLSAGMNAASDYYLNEGIRYEFRSLPPDDAFFDTVVSDDPKLTHDELVWLSLFAPNLARIVDSEPPLQKEETRRRAQEELAAILRDLALAEGLR